MPDDTKSPAEPPAVQPPVADKIPVMPEKDAPATLHGPVDAEPPVAQPPKVKQPEPVEQQPVKVEQEKQPVKAVEPVDVPVAPPQPAVAQPAPKKIQPAAQPPVPSVAQASIIDDIVAGRVKWGRGCLAALAGAFVMGAAAYGLNQLSKSRRADYDPAKPYAGAYRDDPVDEAQRRKERQGAYVEDLAQGERKDVRKDEPAGASGAKAGRVNRMDKAYQDELEQLLKNVFEEQFKTPSGERITFRFHGAAKRGFDVAYETLFGHNNDRGSYDDMRRRFAFARACDAAGSIEMKQRLGTTKLQEDSHIFPEDVEKMMQKTRVDLDGILDKYAYQTLDYLPAKQ